MPRDGSPSPGRKPLADGRGGQTRALPARARYVRSMARSAERLTVECPRCGQVFETWALGTPELDCDPELGDPGWVSAAAAATCPHCGGTSCCSGLAAEREAWRDL
jgi:hypothetical protein